jgi:hypothetical protein
MVEAFMLLLISLAEKQHQVMPQGLTCPDSRVTNMTLQGFFEAIQVMHPAAFIAKQRPLLCVSCTS